MNYQLATGPIVVGTYFSIASTSVVEYTAALAIAESKPLRLVYVMPMLPDDSPSLVEIQRDELNGFRPSSGRQPGFATDERLSIPLSSGRSP